MATTTMLDQGLIVEELTVAIGTSFNPSFVLILNTTFNAMPIIPVKVTTISTTFRGSRIGHLLKRRDNFGPFSVTWKHLFAGSTRSFVIEPRIIDNGQQDGHWHPVWF